MKPALRPDGASLREALHAEWTKLRTVPSTGWLLLTAIALTVGASALATAVEKCPASCRTDTTKLSLTGILLGQAAVAVLAVLVMTGEYSSGMIRTTLTAMPRRTTALAAKAAIVTGVVLAAGTVAVFGSVLAGHFILPGNGFTTAHGFAALSLGHGPTLRAAAGSVLYLALIALLSLGLATALRDSGATIAAVLALLYVVPVLTELGTLDPAWQHRLQRYGPMTAGLAIQATRNLGKLPIGPWAGLGVLAAWAAAALLAGGVLLRVRDA
jgi:ABC-2 type transport system permease protein